MRIKKSLKENTHLIYTTRMVLNFKRQIETRDQSGIIIVHITICLSGAAAAKSLQSCPTLCDPIDGGLPGSPVPGILQGRILEWVAISSSNTWKWKVKVKSLSCVRHLATPWTVAYQAPLSMGFSREEYWSGLPFPSPVDLPDPGIEPKTPALAGRFFTTVPPGKPLKVKVTVVQSLSCV